MKTNTLHITNPSKGLLDLVRKLQADKETAKKELRDKAHEYFPKKK
jgi:hypothetical protein